MKAVAVLAVLACVAVMVSASGPGLGRVWDGVAAPYNNARRQVYVNDRAEWKGASSGTARYEGVPGAGNDFGYGYGYGRPYGYDDGYYGRW